MKRNNMKIKAYIVAVGMFLCSVLSCLLVSTVLGVEMDRSVVAIAFTYVLAVAYLSRKYSKKNVGNEKFSKRIKHKIMRSKYIDAEKLYKQVDSLMAHYAKAEKEVEIDDEELSIFYQGKRKMCSELLGIIDSHRHEQPAEWSKERKDSKVVAFGPDAHAEGMYGSIADTDEEEIKKIRSEEYTKGSNDAAFGGKLKDWSKKDELMRNRCISDLGYLKKYTPQYGERYDEQIAWLNSLRPQPHWKPSEEQSGWRNRE